jgi:predicted PurR-regulated permease PerM
MAFPDRRTVDILLTALLFVAVLGVIYLARTVLIIFCFSILFAYLIDPV